MHHDVEKQMRTNPTHPTNLQYHAINELPKGLVATFQAIKSSNDRFRSNKSSPNARSTIPISESVIFVHLPFGFE